MFQNPVGGGEVEDKQLWGFQDSVFYREEVIKDLRT